MNSLLSQSNNSRIPQYQQRESLQNPNLNGHVQNASTSTETTTIGNDALANSAETAVGMGKGVGSGVDGSGGGGLWNSLGNIADNSLFTAGFGLMGLGAAFQILRRSSLRLATVAQRRLLVSLEISARDPAYLWVLQWVTTQTQAQGRALAMTMNTGVGRSSSSGISNGDGKENMAGNGNDGDGTRMNLIDRWLTRLRPRSDKLALETEHQQRASGGTSTIFSLVPGVGTHYFRYGGVWFQALRERSSSSTSLMTGQPYETITLTTLSRPGLRLFPQLLSQAKNLSQSSRLGKLVVYTAWGTDWKQFGSVRMRRKLESVVLENGKRERIVGDVESFLNRGGWYSERGIPYRRGYLLHGPPGSGKSCLVEAIAGHFEYDICILNLSERGMTDDKLNHLLAKVPEKSIVLLEDVDSAFRGRTRTDESSGIPLDVTFSGLLNVLDGLASASTERILFMTTNHIERLDPALIRPGRVDIIEYIGDATPGQVGKLYERFYGSDGDNDEGRDKLAEAEGDGTRRTEKSQGLSKEELAALKEELVGKVTRAIEKGQRFSMAALQGHLIRHDARSAVRDWEMLLSPQGDLVVSGQGERADAVGVEGGETRNYRRFASSP